MNDVDESRKLEENIANRYTMESERKAFEKATGQMVTAEDSLSYDEDDGITFL